MNADREDIEKWRRLRRMSAEEALRIGEALWMSDLARIAQPRRTRRPLSLAIALGIGSRGRVVR